MTALSGLSVRSSVRPYFHTYRSLLFSFSEIVSADVCSVVILVLGIEEEDFVRDDDILNGAD